MHNTFYVILTATQTWHRPYGDPLVTRLSNDFENFPELPTFPENSEPENFQLPLPVSFFTQTVIICIRRDTEIFKSHASLKICGIFLFRRYTPG
jgi:hypothetical protein